MATAKTPEQIAEENAAKVLKAQQAAEAKAAKEVEAATKKAAKEAEAAVKAAEKAAKLAADTEALKAAAVAKAAEDAKAKIEAAAKAKADKEAAKLAKAAEKTAKAEAKIVEAAAKAAAKEANRMPEQNGIRRPGPNGKCGGAWALMDAMSAEIGGPVAISDLMVRSNAAGMNPAMVRSNYAVWRKFNNVQGRVASVAKAAAVATPAVPA